MHALAMHWPAFVADSLLLQKFIWLLKNAKTNA